MGGVCAVIPDVAELCAMGEAAFENHEFEEAEAWYELACSGRYRDPNPHRDRKHDRLIEKRFARWEQLRSMMYQRSVRRLTHPDPRHVLGIMTCEGRSSINRLWRSLPPDLTVSWPGAKIMMIDGHRWRSWKGWNIQATSHAGERMGQAATFFALLQEASSVQGMTALTLLEDDVVLARNALYYIASTRIDDDLGFISWFSVYCHNGPRIPPLFHCIEARDYQFNQAITFPARTVHELLASDALKNWSEPHGADRIYKDVFPDRKVAIHYPNLVQHIGGTASLVGNNDHGPRTSPTFIGESADALALVDR